MSPVEADLAGAIDNAHVGPAKLGLDLVVAEVADRGRGFLRAGRIRTRGSLERALRRARLIGITPGRTCDGRLGGRQGHPDQAETDARNVGMTGVRS
jgi:hypothetical protein